MEAESLEMAEARIREVAEDDAQEMPGEWELVNLDINEVEA